ncbi:MAG TPA: MazG family protein [Angustibacter sp.]|nr:MazG family protein [Angustibacter sp.]
MSAPADLVLLVTTPRVAAGLLTRAGWQALEQAGRVLCADLGDPTPAAVADAGVVVEQAEQQDAASLARGLVEAAAAAPVVWLTSPDGDPGLTDALAAELSRVATHTDPPSVEVLVASHDVRGARLLDLVEVMDRLRSPGGCPWDAEQTHESLVPYLVEEAYEAAEALESADRTAMREELGDVLLQVAFHARVGQEHPDEPFDIDDVASGIVTKLVRRHPHVFAVDVAADGGEPAAGHTAEQVQQRWDELKAQEKGRASLLDGIPRALPALARADKVLGRLQRSRPGDVEALTVVDDEIARELLHAVRRAQEQGVDAEARLRQAVQAIEARVRQLEGSLPDAQ